MDEVVSKLFNQKSYASFVSRRCPQHPTSILSRELTWFHPSLANVQARQRESFHMSTMMYIY